VDDEPVEGDEVWVAETWCAYGEDRYVQGLYDSREAAFEALKDIAGMTVYVGGDQNVHGRPRNPDGPKEWREPGGRGWMEPDRRTWAFAKPMRVRGRKADAVSARPQSPEEAR
jgi:hypothetical protein